MAPARCLLAGPQAFHDMDSAPSGVFRAPSPMRDAEKVEESTMPVQTLPSRVETTGAVPSTPGTPVNKPHEISEDSPMTPVVTEDTAGTRPPPLSKTLPPTQSPPMPASKQKKSVSEPVTTGSRYSLQNVMNFKPIPPVFLVDPPHQVRRVSSPSECVPVDVETVERPIAAAQRIAPRYSSSVFRSSPLTPVITEGLNDTFPALSEKRLPPQMGLSSERRLIEAASYLEMEMKVPTVSTQSAMSRIKAVLKGCGNKAHVKLLFWVTGGLVDLPRPFTPSPALKIALECNLSYVMNEIDIDIDRYVDEMTNYEREVRKERGDVLAAKQLISCTEQATMKKRISARLSKKKIDLTCGALRALLKWWICRPNEQERVFSSQLLTMFEI